MFDSNFVSPVLPVGYSITEFNDEYYAITPDGGQVGSGFYHYNEAVDRAIQHFEFTKFNDARIEELCQPWDWYEAHDEITKECTLPYIENDGSRIIDVYFEGHEYAGKHHDIARFKAAGFDEAISLDNAFLYR